MKPALFRSEAEAELEEAVAYYEGAKPGLGRDFRKRVEAAVLKIRETPLRWSPLGPDTRRIHVGRFPYAVVYTDSLRRFSSSPSRTIAAALVIGRTEYRGRD